MSRNCYVFKTDLASRKLSRSLPSNLTARLPDGPNMPSFPGSVLFRDQIFSPLLQLLSPSSPPPTPFVCLTLKQLSLRSVHSF